MDTSKCSFDQCQHRKQKDRTECRRIHTRLEVKRLETLKRLIEEKLRMIEYDRFKNIEGGY